MLSNVKSTPAIVRTKISGWVEYQRVEVIDNGNAD
jgi:hypothetical protein